MAVIKYCILAQDKLRIDLGLLIVLWAVAMAVVRNLLLRREMNMTIWRLLCLAPLLLCVVHFAFCYFRGSFVLNLQFYFTIYGAALMLAVLQFFHGGTKRLTLPCIGIAILGIVGLVSGLLFAASGNVTVGNYSKCTYEEAFRGIVADMKQHYCLSDWKEIDYDELEKRILPKVQQADATGDEASFYEALCEYRYYFYDWHLILLTQNERGAAAEKTARERLAGYDHGFAMFTLDSGETVAVMVEENSDAYWYGIRFGTTIIKWNGIPIEEALASVQCIYPDYGFSVKENEDRVKAIFLAGTGGEQVEVTFRKATGEERTVTIGSHGSYRERMELALNRFYRVTTLAPCDREFGNYYTKMLNENTGYLRIERESYKVMSDAIAMMTGEYDKLTDYLDGKLAALQKEGMEYLIVDARNNRGGSDDISGAVAALFTDEKLYNYGFGEYVNGEYVIKEEHWVKGTGKWKDLTVVLLVNSECLSAGDRLASLMAQCPNVSLVGMTVTNGIDQNPTAICVTPNSDFILRYPSVFSLGENGEPNNDTGADRVSRVELDQYIPIDETALRQIFEEDADYELRYSVEFCRNRLNMCKKCIK